MVLKDRMREKSAMHTNVVPAAEKKASRIYQKAKLKRFEKFWKKETDFDNKRGSATILLLLINIWTNTERMKA